MAQVDMYDANGNKIIPYYIDITNFDNAVIKEINGQQLNLGYNDKLGKSSTLLLKVLNWKQEIVMEQILEKTFGLNYFRINVTNKLNPYDQYVVEVTDELNKKHSVILRYVPPKEIPLEVNVLVNPKIFDCAIKEGNLIEFYGQIEGGRIPYRIHWYVVNNKRSDLLYQPKEDYVTELNKTSSIEVSGVSDCYVLILVTDACGNEQKQAVHVSCENGEKSINTVFFENIPNILNPSKPGN